jgi:hypothetical protein
MGTKAYFEVKQLMNLTTEINMLKYNSDDPVEAVEYSLDRMSFEVGEKSCRQGQLVSIKGLVHIEGKSSPLAADGKIAEVIPLGAGRIKVVIEMHHYDKALWHSFVDLLKDRQSQVDKIFRAMREDE